MRIHICGEGVHEHGRIFWCERSTEYKEEEGWLQPLIRTLIGDEPDPNFQRVERSSLVGVPGSTKPKLSGHAVKAFRALRRAERDGADIVVYMVDCDSTRVDDWRSKVGEIAAVGAYAKRQVSIIACVPMSMSECWLMSDHDAWLGLGLSDTSKLPAHPERLWGDKHDPGSHYPKNVFAKVCVEAGLSDSVETRNLVMSQTRSERLAAACNNSFPRFRDDIQAAIVRQTEA